MRATAMLAAVMAVYRAGLAARGESEVQFGYRSLRPRHSSLRPRVDDDAALAGATYQIAADDGGRCSICRRTFRARRLFGSSFGP